MFYQVSIEPKDFDAFRFLWWENNDPQVTPTEYGMLKHVFGATSSPSCANFCLKKTASTYEKEFDPKVAETIQRNMYLDDLMKSVGMTEIAIKLVKQLRELLKKGGFRLTKWLSNDREVLAEIPENERASLLARRLTIFPQNVLLELNGRLRLTKFVWEVHEETLALARKEQ